MLFDTNIIIRYIRQLAPLPTRTVLSIVVAAELEVFASRLGWGESRQIYLTQLREKFPPIEITDQLRPIYAQLDAYSQGHLRGLPLPPGLSARNMGKNDLWIAATALYFELPLHTDDRDFDHLAPLGLRVVRA